MAQIEGAASSPGAPSTAPATWPAPRGCSIAPSRFSCPGPGFSFVEILTMCPTGWFIETEEAPSYLDDSLAAVHAPGVLKDLAEQ